MFFDPQKHEVFLTRKTALYFIRTVYAPANPNHVIVPVKVKAGYAIRIDGHKFLAKPQR